MKIKLFLVTVGLFVGLWGITWCLPQKSRVNRVLPQSLDTPEFRKSLLESWQRLHAKLGKDLIVSEHVFDRGFKRDLTLEAGWSTPPEALINSARAFHLRSAYPDEAGILRGVASLKPHRLQFNPHIYWYGNSYMIPLAAWIGVSSLISPVKLVSGLGYYLENIDKMAAIFLSGRLFSAAVFWACALLLVVIGKRHFSERAGLIAAGLFLVSPGLAFNSHLMKPHMLGVMFVLIGFSLCADMLKTGGTRRGILAGAAFGVAAGAAIHLSVATLIVAAAFGMRLRDGEDFLSECRWVGASALSFFAAYLLFNNYWITDFSATLTAMKEMFVISGKLEAKTSGLVTILTFATKGLWNAMTLPIWLVFAYGLVQKNNFRTAVGNLAVFSILLFLISSALYATVDHFSTIRYFGGSLIGFLLAGAAIDAHGKGVKAFAAAAFVYGLTATSVLNYNLYLDATGRSTKDRAGDWIEQEIPAGSELCMLRMPEPSNSPYFQWNRYRLRFVHEEAVKDLAASGALPEYIILTHAGGTDEQRFAPLAKHYKLLKKFDSFSLGPINFPTGQILGNPPVEIFKRSKPLDNTTAAIRITHGIAETL